jgi:hypothetical protein
MLAATRAAGWADERAHRVFRKFKALHPEPMTEAARLKRWHGWVATERPEPEPNVVPFPRRANSSVDPIRTKLVEALPVVARTWKLGEGSSIQPIVDLMEGRYQNPDTGVYNFHRYDLEADIIPVVRKLTLDAIEKNDPISDWTYFPKAIMRTRNQHIANTGTPSREHERYKAEASERYEQLLAEAGADRAAFPDCVVSEEHRQRRLSRLRMAFAAARASERPDLSHLTEAFLAKEEARIRNQPVRSGPSTSTAG